MPQSLTLTACGSSPPAVHAAPIRDKAPCPPAVYRAAYARYGILAKCGGSPAAGPPLPCPSDNARRPVAGGSFPESRRAIWSPCACSAPAWQAARPPS